MNKPNRTSIHQIRADQEHKSLIAAITAIIGDNFDEDEPAPAPAPTAPLSTCAIAPTETGHKLTLQVESDADLHSLTTWLLECLESLPAS